MATDTMQLVAELQEFHHYEAAKRLKQLPIHEEIQTLLTEMRQKEPVAYSPRMEALYQLSAKLQGR